MIPMISALATQALKAAAGEEGAARKKGGGQSQKKGAKSRKGMGKGGGFRIALQEAERQSLEDSVLLVHDRQYVNWLERFYAACEIPPAATPRPLPAPATVCVVCVFLRVCVVCCVCVV